jgi:hypothetical protein
VRTRIDTLLVGPGSGVFSAFEQLKVDPGRPGVENPQAEIAKLRAIRSLGLAHEPFVGVPLIGSEEIWACVPEDCDAQPVRSFGTLTPDL